MEAHQAGRAQAGVHVEAAKRVTFTGVPCLEELRRGHKQQRSSLAQVPSAWLYLLAIQYIYRHHPPAAGQRETPPPPPPSTDAV